jgi:nitrile hydratase subunit beta
MNGIHDIGGTDGFGPVLPEPNEPVFHEPWEGRVFAMSMLRAGVPVPTSIDDGRHQIECLPPIQYISSSYYERWLARAEARIVRAGTLTREEIDAKAGQFAANPELVMPRREDPAFAERISAILRAGNPVARAIQEKPRFAVGDRVRTRNLNPPGHTRLPRYARGRQGVITAHHGVHVFPDTNAHGLGENPQHLYNVRISARELWGDTAEPNECVLIDLWESYLEPIGNRAEAGTARRPMKKVRKTKPTLRSRKTPRRRAKSKRRKA